MGRTKPVNKSVVVRPQVEDVVDAEIVPEEPGAPMTELISVAVSDHYSLTPIFDELVDQRGLDPLDPWAVETVARRQLAQDQEALFV